MHIWKVCHPLAVKLVFVTYVTHFCIPSFIKLAENFFLVANLLVFFGISPLKHM